MTLPFEFCHALNFQTDVSYTEKFLINDNSIGINHRHHLFPLNLPDISLVSSEELLSLTHSLSKKMMNKMKCYTVYHLLSQWQDWDHFFSYSTYTHVLFYTHFLSYYNRRLIQIEMITKSFSLQWYQVHSFLLRLVELQWVYLR